RGREQAPGVRRHSVLDRRISNVRQGFTEIFAHYDLEKKPIPEEEHEEEEQEGVK
ncbi:Uncharacterized protein FKW44_010824, partial [Caligus rogercresseyi]